MLRKNMGGETLGGDTRDACVSYSPVLICAGLGSSLD